ncbi:MAG: hypothetical protein JWM31_2710 [Solirubrobacterales bacterium]|nr:hypothetical protein [Solirubrobacterales bacterium]
MSHEWKRAVLPLTHVTVCSTSDMAIGTSDFTLDLKDGGHGHVRFPAQSYGDGFSSARSGCTAGWLVFELPSGRQPIEVRLAYDNTGSHTPSGGTHHDLHARFAWAL